MTQAYPLQWPAMRARTNTRRRAAFGKRVSRPGQSWQSLEDLTVADAVRRLQDEVDRLGVTDYVLSTNLALRLDGLPRSDQKAPSDPGACLYFKMNGKPHALPCDTYDRVADNINAIAKHIEATRAIERYGVSTIAEMFTGFAALPSPGAARAWWEVLGVSQHASADEINAAWRSKARESHPDRGGSNDLLSEINVARDTGLKAREEA